MNANITVSDISTESNFSAQIIYNSTDSTLQCKFQGYVHKVEWYLSLAYAHIEPYLGVNAVLLGLGNQYHQSTIQATNLKNHYVNELTIINGSAPFGPYRCVALTGNSYHRSADLSICKLETCNYY